MSTCRSRIPWLCCALLCSAVLSPDPPPPTPQQTLIFTLSCCAQAASLNHNFSLADVSEENRKFVFQEYEKDRSRKTGAHIDGPPFVALLINDRPGLQVVAAEGKWINAPVTCRTSPGEYPVPIIPGSVIVNAGGTLMHLSKGVSFAQDRPVPSPLYTLMPPIQAVTLQPFTESTQRSSPRARTACRCPFSLFRRWMDRSSLLATPILGGTLVTLRPETEERMRRSTGWARSHR